MHTFEIDNTCLTVVNINMAENDGFIHFNSVSNKTSTAGVSYLVYNLYICFIIDSRILYFLML